MKAIPILMNLLILAALLITGFTTIIDGKPI